MSVLKNNLDLELVEIINSLENDKLLVTSYKTHSENLEDINQVQTLLPRLCPTITCIIRNLGY